MSDPQEPVRVSEVLRASQLKETLHHYGEALRARRKGIDRLNVYPVPDGDTGTNMSLTVQSVVAELKGAAADDMHAISAAISKGAIMGARGNSGAILAQALRGVAESVKEKSSLSPEDVAQAFERARKGAYESVLKPVEGTILTVLTAAATAARKSADEGHKLKDQLDEVRLACAEALARTPELLPQLKQAGVVDAGGSGFLLFIDAMRFVATGEPIPGAVDSDDDDEGELIEHAHDELSDLRYEIMFILEAKDKDIAGFKTAWSELGDSIVVVGGGGLFNCHIHADDIGPTIEAAIEIGKPSQIRITDLQEQVATRDHEPTAEAPVTTGVVAVVNGNELAKTYRSLGAAVVTGGQSMNPSVSDLLAAVDKVNADHVLLLPNNKNIVAAAEQVDALSAKSVRVVRTTNPVQGLSALVDYDPEADLASNGDAFDEVVSAVTWGEVTQAVRNSDSDAGAITEGDWIGVTAAGIAVVAASLEAATLALVETLVTDDNELVTVLEGKDADQAVTEALVAWLGEHRSGSEVQVQRGGQPLYPYVFGVE